MNLLYAGDTEAAQDITSAHDLKLDGDAIVVSLFKAEHWLMVIEFDTLDEAANRTFTLRPRVKAGIGENYMYFPEKTVDLPIAGQGNGMILAEFFLQNPDSEAWTNFMCSIQSDNGSDSSVEVRCKIYNLDAIDTDGRINVGRWLDAPVTKNSNNFPDVNAENIFDDSDVKANLTAALDGTGYAGGATKLDVNVDTVNEETPMTAADIEALTHAAKLASNGLSAVSKTEPTGDPSTWTFQDRLNWLVRRFANKATLTLPPGGEGTLKVRNDADDDDLSSQDVDETGTNQLTLGAIE